MTTHCDTMPITHKTVTMLVVALLLVLAAVGPAAAFDCAKVTTPDGSKSFDLTSLKHDFESTQNAVTPPTTTLFKRRMNLCQPLAVPNDGLDPEEHCASDTWVCQQSVVTTSKGTSFVYQVVNLVRGPNPLPQVDYRASPDNRKEGSLLVLEFDGEDGANGHVKTVFELECATVAEAPGVVQRNVTDLTVHWKTPAACEGSTGVSPPPADPNKGIEHPKESSSSAFGTFCWFLFIAFIVYMVAGTLYRRFVLHATGTDQIPHYDLWVQLPAMAMDAFHTIKALVSGRNQGYIQV
ncbi:hypothetical protein AMAG_09891 [Allomyces macrogynus ATCC 38327]|uniref:Autophagy-related protein 27 n=1 Tax=Allomyces macrogynus (strain ATCC 38327) TaxID=578462 RepID=A0A0L0SPW0_ALLM3|nr:hypothetical protein AMAG_09891 [Allomyces macrogynus ATCC 38327]|eukprot:KNE64531.1 hypothetical protein AMAG_09891 [Allomyces macrogynus ATCC 38327]